MASVSKEMQITDMTDPEFYAYLRSKSKEYTFKSNEGKFPYTNYFDEKKNIIALVIYDNQKTRRIYIPK